MTSAVVKLAELLGSDDATLRDEVQHAPDEPAAYAALIVGLERLGKLREIDWKDDVREVAHAIGSLLPPDPTRFAWADEPRYDEMPTPRLLHVFGAALARSHQALVSIDTRSDSYRLLVLDDKTAAKARALASRGFGRIVIWNKGPLPKAPKATPSRRGTGPERIELPFQTGGPFLEAAGQVAVFTQVNPDRSVYCDLRSCPPRMVERDEVVKSIARGADGTFLIAAERNWQGTVRRVRDPFVDKGVALTGVTEKELSKCGFVGRSAFVISGAIDSRSRGYLEKSGKLRPVELLSARRDSDDASIIPISDDRALCVWGNRAWELGGKKPERSFLIDTDDYYFLGHSPTVRIGDDGFYFSSGGRLREIHRGQKAKTIEIKCGNVSAVRRGPEGSLLLSTFKKGSPIQIELYFPTDNTIIRLDRKLLGIRDHYWAAWAGDRLWLLDQDSYDLVSLAGETVLGQPRSRAS